MRRKPEPPDPEDVQAVIRSVLKVLAGQGWNIINMDKLRIERNPQAGLGQYRLVIDFVGLNTNLAEGG